MKQIENKHDNLEYKEKESTIINKVHGHSKAITNYVLALDIETSGSSFVKNGILSIGASLQDADSIEQESFQVNMLLDEERSYEKECKEKFWDKFPKAQAFVENNALHPKDAMQYFATFLSKIDIQYPKVTIVSDNPSFDIAWLDYYLSAYTDVKPLRYSSVDSNYRMVWDTASVQKTWLCLKFPELPFYSQLHGHREKLGLDSSYLHDHNPLNDARVIASHYNQTIKQMSQFREAMPMQKAPRVIKLTEYNPEWKDNFLFEEHWLKDAFKESKSLDNLVDILHVGSTSVTGLVAKPIIDIIVVVKNSDSIDNIFSQAGYKYKGEYNIPMRKMYGKNEEYEVYLHAYEEGNSEIILNLIFRDYLNSHIEAREEYSNLKQAILEKDNSHSKLVSTGITTYNLEKNDFIQTILVKAGFMELCMRLCTQNVEWESYHAIRNIYLSKISTIHEINTNDSNQKHIVLHAGVKVVAAAQLQLSPPNAFLEFSGCSNEIQSEVGQKFQSYLLKNIEKWIKKLSVIFLTTSVSLDDVSAYTDNGYKTIDNKKDVVHMLKCLIEPNLVLESQSISLTGDFLYNQEVYSEVNNVIN